MVNQKRKDSGRSLLIHKYDLKEEQGVVLI